MDIKKIEKICTPKTSNRKVDKINNNISLKKQIKNNDIIISKNNKKINININKSFLRKKDSSKNKITDKKLNRTTYKTYKIRKSKALSNNNVIKDINKTRQENNLYNINNIINNRFSCRIPNKIINNDNNSNLKKRLTIKRTLNKQLKEINLTNNDINDNSKKLNKNKTNIIISLNNISKKENTKEKIEILRRTNILHDKKKIYENLNLFKDTKEKKDEDEIKNKVIKHNTSVFILEKNKLFSDESKNKKNPNKNKNKKNCNEQICQINTCEHELDKFFRNNNNINNDLIRFSNISNINKNDVFYLNKNITEVRNNNNLILMNNKIETIEANESHELLDFEEKILEEIKDNQNQIEQQIITVPCLICNKLINIDEADEHSNKCYNSKKNNTIKNKDNIDNYLIIIHNKLKNILEYLDKIQKNDKYNYDNTNTDIKENTEFINELKSYINKILNIKELNSSSINELSKINNKINTQMGKCLNCPNIFTLYSRTKILLEEKSKFFSDKIKKTNISKKNLEENSFDEILSESETAEFFDLKKMEKILDEKELKTESLEKLINETKNKRLFLMEVLKVKFQKINENKKEDLIPPEMIWKEAVKNNIEMKNWTQFIFNELNNPNKYLTMIQKKNIKSQQNNKK